MAHIPPASLGRVTLRVVYDCVLHLQEMLLATCGDIHSLKSDLQQVKGEARGVKSDIHVLKHTVQLLRRDVAGMERRVSGQIDMIDSRLDAVEVTEIPALKKAVARP